MRYDMCDAITGSRSRPVTATFEVSVPQPEPPVSLAGVGPSLSLNTGLTSTQHTMMICRVHVSGFNFSSPSPLQLFGGLPFFRSAGRMPNVGHFTIYYPLPSEDPFSAERGGMTPRRVASSSALHTTLSTASLRGLARNRNNAASHTDLSSLEGSIQPIMRRREYTFSVSSPAINPTSLASPTGTRPSPRATVKTGFTFESMVCPRTSRHALIRFWDTDGVEFAQGVFPVAPPRPVSETEGAEVTRDVTVDLVHGCRAVGSVQLHLDVSTEHPPPEQQPPLSSPLSQQQLSSLPAAMPLPLGIGRNVNRLSQ